MTRRRTFEFSKECRRRKQNTNKIEQYNRAAYTHDTHEHTRTHDTHARTHTHEHTRTNTHTQAQIYHIKVFLKKTSLQRSGPGHAVSANQCVAAGQNVSRHITNAVFKACRCAQGIRGSQIITTSAVGAAVSSGGSSGREEKEKYPSQGCCAGNFDKGFAR